MVSMIPIVESKKIITDPIRRISPHCKPTASRKQRKSASQSRQAKQSSKETIDYIWHMSRRLLVIFAVTAVILGYLFFMEKNRYMGIPMGIFVTLGIVTWVLQHQIDWWWINLRPQKLPQEIHQLFELKLPFYRDMEPEIQGDFGRKVGLYVTSKDFIGMGKEKVPDDVQYMTAAYAVTLGHAKANYMLDGYDRIVFYKHPFLTPHYGQQVHTYEVEHADGTVILAMDQFVAGFLNPGTYYQTGWHAMAEVYHALNMANVDYPKDLNWDILEQISGVSKSKVEEHTGMAQEDPWPVAVHHYFSYPSKFEHKAPKLHQWITDQIIK